MGKGFKYILKLQSLALAWELSWLQHHPDTPRLWAESRVQVQQESTKEYTNIHEHIRQVEQQIDVSPHHQPSSLSKISKIKIKKKNCMFESMYNS